MLYFLTVEATFLRNASVTWSRCLGSILRDFSTLDKPMSLEELEAELRPQLFLFGSDQSTYWFSQTALATAMTVR